MSNINTEEKAKSQDRKALNNFSQDVMFDFLYGERVRNLLERTYTIAMTEDPKISIPLLKYLLDRYFGKPIQLQKDDHIKSSITLEDLLAAFDSPDAPYPEG